MSSFGATMQLPANLRARISALGELSRPLGDTRAASLARALANAVAADVAYGRNPDATIDGWLRRLAAEIVEKRPADAPPARKPSRPSKPAGTRSIGDVLPEIH
jgi:hypothetical protein